MYNVNIEEMHDITIGGQLFICETVSPNERFGRRDFNRMNIINGTQIVTRGPYIPKDISFTTHVWIDPTRPDMYDDVFEELMSQPQEVISPELGGKFNAQIIIKPEHDKYSMLKLTVQVIEIPDTESKIPGENRFTIPEDKLESEEEKKAREEENKQRADGKTQLADKGKLYALRNASKQQQGLSRLGGG